MNNAVFLVATDLDGSLLDHYDYNCEAAKPMLQLLEELRIPVVFVSSKTRTEILTLREELGNEHPFIVENGAAVLIPKGYFLADPEGVEERGDYLLREFTQGRDCWVSALDELRASMPDCFENFAHAGVEGIVAMTGLDPEQARLANEREYSEPVQWRGSDAQLSRFLDTLRDAGANVVKGGRFYSVAGPCDKGRALQWLRDQYALASGTGTVYDLAIGDGHNDVPMLEIAHRALKIPAPDRALPSLERTEGVIVGEGLGPEAWAWGVREWLRAFYETPEEV